MTNTTGDDTIPVTVLTGFLGAGKTTLLNRILTEEHGHRIAVIENEFGEIGIDNELVIDADEEIFEMNNGCICCTVRGDLIRILSRLVKRRDRFDRILVETTGLAEPGPVAQTFFVDDELAAKFRLDGIITVVDAGHFDLHIQEDEECAQQVAFADALVLNKIDLVDDAEELDALEDRLRTINPAARFMRCQNAGVAIEDILDIGGFDIDRALEVNPDFLEPEYPFEWGGMTRLEEGAYELHFQPGADPSIDAVVLPFEEAATLSDHVDDALRLYSADPVHVDEEDQLYPGPSLSRIHLSMEEHTVIPFDVPQTGHYGFYLEHFPAEFHLKLCRADDATEVQWAKERDYLDDHEHDDTVGSVGLEFAGAGFNIELLNRWLMELLSEHGPDIFRMKGVLHIHGRDERYVFQGVHMLFDIQPQRLWREDEQPHSEMIFIGRNLDEKLLAERFQQCLA